VADALLAADVGVPVGPPGATPEAESVPSVLRLAGTKPPERLPAILCRDDESVSIPRGVPALSALLAGAGCEGIVWYDWLEG
jgi:hypothetical protein